MRLSDASDVKCFLVRAPLACCILLHFISIITHATTTDPDHYSPLDLDALPGTAHTDRHEYHPSSPSPVSHLFLLGFPRFRV